MKENTIVSSLALAMVFIIFGNVPFIQGGQLIQLLQGKKMLSLLTTLLHLAYPFLAPPSFINTIKYANASIADEIAEIKCDIECYPECEVSWKKNGTSINNSSKE